MSTAAPREVEIALVLSPDAWVERLHRHCADHGGARVRCIVVDPAVATEEDFDVLVVSERWPALSRPFVDAVHACGRRVLAVVDDATADATAFVERLGVDAVVAACAAPVDLVATVVRVAPAERDDRGAHAARSEAVVDGPPLGVVPRLPLLAVGGPFGAGSTEVALGLAAAAARRGARPVLVDADTVTPSVAVRLGLPLEPNLCTAVDAVAYGLGAVPGALFDLGPEWPAVLTGAPTRAAAAGLAPSDVVAVGTVLAARYAPVVCDVSAGDPGDDAGDDLIHAVLARAAVVVAVGAATPVGVVRLLEWLDALTDGTSDPMVEVVVNRAPTGRARRAELVAEIRHGARVAGVHFVPADPRVEDAAWDATVSDRGPFARAVDELWTRLAPPCLARDSVVPT